MIIVKTHHLFLFLIVFQKHENKFIISDVIKKNTAITQAKIKNINTKIIYGTNKINSNILNIFSGIYYLSARFKYYDYI